jgi:arylsulfatase A-like enzyme
LKTTGLAVATAAINGCTPDIKSFDPDAVKDKPNILWITVEDMSPHWSCYGEKTIKTPNIDRLAAGGAIFTRAFVTSPVCSPSRSAMITGMYQTTIGAHQHRSSYAGSEILLPKNIRLLPEYFKQNGYYTVNAGPKKTVYHKHLQWKGRAEKLGKADYNFIWNPDIYDDSDWKTRPPGKPFFAQIQFGGGKSRSAKGDNPVDPDDIKLPPQYPDTPRMRQDWAGYLNSILKLDRQIGDILKRLDDENIADNTVVFLWTDHGMYHIRAKQFLYDEGIAIPMIIRWPGVIKPGTIRADLVEHIDIAATSLYVAGIEIPDHIQARPLFGPKRRRRRYIFSARDRCDETLDCIRCIRTANYKYIRNFYPNRPWLQPNRYINTRNAMKLMRELHAQKKLTSVQAKVFDKTKPPEELYDLQNDPQELNNLVDSPDHSGIVQRMRRILSRQMLKTRDLGIIPEPVIEELVQKTPHRHQILIDPKNMALLNELLQVIDAGQINPDENLLIEKMKHPEAAVRWWAARLLGNQTKDQAGVTALIDALQDESPAVRVEVARALCISGNSEDALAVLLKELKNDNQIVRHYTALAFEDIGWISKAVYDALEAATEDDYQYVRLIATRYVNTYKSKLNP